MPINDPVADMLTRIRNAIHSRHNTVLVPQSKVKVAIADILKAQGYITGIWRATASFRRCGCIWPTGTTTGTPSGG